jgi:RND family efflux transporter MFP subunit
MRIPARFLVSLGCAAAIAGCGSPPPPPEILRPVRTERVEASGGVRTRSFSGVSRAGQETELSFRVSGTIELMAARVGEYVRAGQLLARLETEDFEIRVQQAQANLAKAEANARNAEANLDRIRGLWEDNNASQNDLDSARANAEATQAQVEASERGLESARRQLGYTRLIAPVAGAIADVPVEVNENVSQGQMVVLLTSGSQPEVEVAMPEVLITRVHEGDEVDVLFDALPGEAYKAVVTEVGVAATGAATTFPVTVRLIEGNGSIRSGMAAQVAFRFESGGDADSIYLPPVAVGEDRDGRYVFVLESSAEAGVGTVHRRSVEVNEELAPEGIRILSGVAEGEVVVTAGVRRLRDGQRVKFER